MEHVIVDSKNLVTVVIPTYNRGDVICQAVDSVLRQTYSNVEVIVVDDGSTDGTASRLAQYGSQVRVIGQDNAGPSAARNRGIREANGDIIAFLDSDDSWLPTKIERQVGLLRRVDDSVPCCICNATLQFTNRQPVTSFQNSLLSPSEEEGLWLNVSQVLMHRFLLFNQTAAIRRGVLEKIGGFDETLRYLEDYDLALRLSLLGPFAFINDPLVIYNAGSAGSLAEEAQRKETCLRENVSRIRQRASQTVKANKDYAELRVPISRALRKARWELRVAQLRQKQMPGAATIGRILERVWHYCGAVADRSPWFERMKTIPVPNEPNRSYH